MPAHLPAELAERLRRVAKTFRTDGDTKAAVRAALASRHETKDGETR